MLFVAISADGEIIYSHSDRYWKVQKVFNVDMELEK